MTGNDLIARLTTFWRKYKNNRAPVRFVAEIYGGVMVFALSEIRGGERGTTLVLRKVVD